MRKTDILSRLDNWAEVVPGGGIYADAAARIRELEAALAVRAEAEIIVAPVKPTMDDFAAGLLTTPHLNVNHLRNGAYTMSRALCLTDNANAHAFFRALYERADAMIDPSSPYNTDKPKHKVPGIASRVLTALRLK